MLPLISLVNEVDRRDNRRQNAEANNERDPGVHRDIDAFLCIYACTQNIGVKYICTDVNQCAGIYCY